MSERDNKEKRNKYQEVFRDIVALLFPFISIIGSVIAMYHLYKGLLKYSDMNL
ncbi:hypothetical protein [Bilophila wadsworthia]|uniref:hypothetical protein n=1 Tax=Bilophila wadsworthia TaxID=35833 RepID=UPI00241E6DB6|nr:hypothetical protein [Bilophila wadsworthia]